MSKQYCILGDIAFHTLSSKFGTLYGSSE